MSQLQSQEFGKIRSFLWPIHRHELKMLLPMMLILFLICFNYTILRNMKDSLVVTASGAEVIPFIKVWVLLPCAILFTLIFSKLSNRFSQERVFYFIILGFIGFFALFAFILYPAREALHPTLLASQLTKQMPVGFKGLISMCSHWTFTGFYVMCELWGSVVMSVLFWGFANEITKISEAGRFYGVFMMGANIATIIAGQFANALSSGNSFSAFFPLGNDPWEKIMMILLSFVIVSGLLAILTFRWMSKNVLTDPCFDEFHLSQKERKKKKRLSIRESFSYLSNSKYLICIAVLVVGYNLVINLVEVVWKDQLAKLYPSPQDYNSYMNNLSSAIGIIATVGALFMSRLLKAIKWTGTALITPVLMLITCAGFFAFLLFQDYASTSFLAIAGTSPLAIAVFFGAAQNALSKAAKYSVFDATKDMAFIPLSHEAKLKGKAAIDGVGSRLGKSGGSVVHQSLLMIFGTVTASCSIVAVIIMGVIVLWIFAAKSLGGQFYALVKETDSEAANELAEKPAAETLEPKTA